MSQIEYADFDRVEMRVGRILSAEPLQGARKPAYKLSVDFGEMGTRWSSAQVTALYQAEELVGRLVVAVTNFPPKRIAGFMSEVLVLGAPNERGEVVLLTPTHDVPLGGRIF
ncbi:MAG TPA: tRNA-binding protein [Longimicrobiaceae bacterium]|jgi:tRNA-binding protein